MSAVILPFDDPGRSWITPPILPAYKHPNGIQSIVWCRFCQRYHCTATAPDTEWRTVAPAGGLT